MGRKLSSLSSQAHETTRRRRREISCRKARRFKSCRQREHFLFACRAVSVRVCVCACVRVCVCVWRAGGRVEPTRPGAPPGREMFLCQSLFAPPPKERERSGSCACTRGCTRGCCGEREKKKKWRVHAANGDTGGERWREGERESQAFCVPSPLHSLAAFSSEQQNAALPDPAPGGRPPGGLHGPAQVSPAVRCHCPEVVSFASSGRWRAFGGARVPQIPSRRFRPAVERTQRKALPPPPPGDRLWRLAPPLFLPRDHSPGL